MTNKKEVVFMPGQSINISRVTPRWGSRVVVLDHSVAMVVIKWLWRTHRVTYRMVVVNDLIFFFWRLGKQSILDKGGVGHFAVAGFPLGCWSLFLGRGWGGWGRLNMVVMKNIVVTWSFVVIMTMVVAVVVTVCPTSQV